MLLFCSKRIVELNLNEIRLKNKTKALLIVVISSIFYCLLFFFYPVIYHPYFSWRCDARIEEQILEYKDQLRGAISDTLFVIDYDYTEKDCVETIAPNYYIDKKISRPIIENKLKPLAYHYIKYVSGLELITFLTENDGGKDLPMGIYKQPTYRVHFWTEVQGLWPRYNVTAIETYYNHDSLITRHFNSSYSIFGLIKQERSFSKEYAGKARFSYFK